MIDRIPAKPKIERIPPKPKGCSAMAFDDLIQASNSKPDRVLVRREHLDEVIACHEKHQEDHPILELQESGRKFYSVDRLRLFAFMVAHGEVRCDVKR